MPLIPPLHKTLVPCLPLPTTKQMGGVPAIPRSAVKQQKNKEEEEEEEEGSEDGSEEEYDEDEEGDDESLSLSSGLLWGSVAIGAVAVSVAALMALGKRR